MVLMNNILRLFTFGAISAAADAAPFFLRSSKSNIQPIARSALVESENGTWDGCLYEVEGVGAFNSQFNFDFTSMDTLPDELIASTYTVGSGAYAPYAHIFDPENIVLGDGEPLQMNVPGGQTVDPLSTSQMVTAFNDVLYASVRTVAQVSPVNGTVHGFFMYMNDTQETDIEIRTGDPTHVHFTNQQTHPGNGETTYAMDAPSDMSSAFHEYRYDWLPDATHFYIDGELILSISRNNPSEAGWLMWNNWSNGWEWTMGPPAEDNAVLIKSISAYFNRTSITNPGCAASSSSTTAVSIETTISSANPVISSTTQTGTSTSNPTTSSDNSIEAPTSSNYVNTTTGASTTFITSTTSSDTSSTTLIVPEATTTSSAASTTSTTTSDTSTTSDSSSTTSMADSTTTTDSTSTTSSSTSTTTTTTSAIPTPTVSCPDANNTIYTDPNTSLPFLIECGIDHSGGDLKMVYVSSFADCISTCASTSTCVDVSLSGAACYMKSSVGTAVDSGSVFGARLVDDDDDIGDDSASWSSEGNVTFNVHELIQLHVDAHLVQILSAD